MSINFVDATNDANHYTKPPPINTDIVENELLLLSYLQSLLGINSHGNSAQ